MVEFRMHFFSFPFCNTFTTAFVQLIPPSHHHHCQSCYSIKYILQLILPLQLLPQQIVISIVTALAVFSIQAGQTMCWQLKPLFDTAIEQKNYYNSRFELFVMQSKQIWHCFGVWYIMFAAAASSIQLQSSAKKNLSSDIHCLNLTCDFLDRYETARYTSYFKWTLLFCYEKLHFQQLF